MHQDILHVEKILGKILLHRSQSYNILRYASLAEGGLYVAKC